MTLKLIKTEEEYDKCLEWVDNMFDKNVQPNTKVGDKLQAILLLIKNYEEEHYTIPKPNRFN